MSSAGTSVVSTDGLVTPKPLSSFSRLSRIVYLYVPAPSAAGLSPSPSPTPTTILLCSWLNGAPKHIEYYARTYMRLYPAARIILVTINTKEFLFQTEARRQSDVKEAVNALVAQNLEQEWLLVHSLSNGGARRVYNIAGAYRILTGKPLPARAYVMDSAPGIPQFRRDMYALSLPLKRLNWFLWLPAMAATLVTVSFVFVTVNWMPKWFWRELVWGPMEGVNNMQLIDRKCVRGFIYSKEDLAIDWRHVEDHAAAAEANGYTVVMKLVESANHVQMFKGKGGEEAYWKFVTDLWGMAIRKD